MTDDAELLGRWRAGDVEAGRSLFDRHHRAVIRMFRHKADHVLDDLVQNTFLRCVEAREQIANASSFRAFLLAVARVELLRHFERRSGPRGRIDPMQTSMADLHTTMGTRLDAGRARDALTAALSTLPVDLQLALELFYWEEMTSREIAEVLSIPHPTVRSRLRLGRERLRAALAERSVAVEDDDIDAYARARRPPTDPDPHEAPVAGGARD